MIVATVTVNLEIEDTPENQRFVDEEFVRDEVRRCLESHNLPGHPNFDTSDITIIMGRRN